MVKAELVQRSPLRILDQSAKGGLLPGHLGVFMSPKGVGKTACLVHVATDQMLQDRNVIHISFRDSTDHIAQWYQDIFTEITRNCRLDQAKETHRQILRKRVFMKFRQKGNTFARVDPSITSLMQDAHFNAKVLIVDGFDFSLGSPQDLEQLKAFAKEKALAVWFSASLKPSSNKIGKNGFPKELEPFADLFSIAISLEPTNGHVRLRLTKDYGISPLPETHLELDTRTLLIRNESYLPLKNIFSLYEPWQFFL